ncbi:MAG: DUF6624 domain-containing protein [Gallionella sp.]|jgi:hypothetical protein
MRRNLWVVIVLGVLACGENSVMARPHPPYDIKVSAANEFDEGVHDTLLKLRGAVDGSLDARELAAFRKLMLRDGWPTVASAGRDGVDAAGDLARLATGDYPLQDALEQVVGNRVDIDIDALAFARLDDDIEYAHGGHQQFGTLLKLENGKVVPSAPVSEVDADSARDFIGLPLLNDYLKAVQARVDAGQSLDNANAIPRLSTPSKKLSDPQLRRQLHEMVIADQDARNRFVKDGMKPDSPLRKKIREVDRKNLVLLKAIFAKHGFPNVGSIGRDGVSMIFLLVQHADSDRAFQKRALALAKPLLKRRELPRAEYAMLVDRVRIAGGEPQLYGTQVKLVDGKIQVLPVEDPERLNNRRESMALAPEADYLGEFHIPSKH